MSAWALIPVKPLTRGKSRLTGVLPDSERSVLNYRLLLNTLQTLARSGEVDHVIVISRDSVILTMAREYGFVAFQEDEDSSDLNLALTQASIVAQMNGATALLVLPADLPLLKPESFQVMLIHADIRHGIVIAPDRQHEGTNALWISPPGLVEFHFGEGSFNAHVNQAKGLNIQVKIVENDSLKLDLDVPDDLDRLSVLDPSYSFMRSNS